MDIYFLLISNSNLEGLNNPLNSAYSMGRKGNWMVEKPLSQEPEIKCSNPGSVPDLQCNVDKAMGISGLVLPHVK